MVNSPLNMRFVFKRERFLQKRKSITESTCLPDLSVGNIQYENNINNFFNECTSYKDSINVLECLYKNNRFDLLESCVQKTINEIIPLTEHNNLNDCINRANNANIGDINRCRIVEAAKIYKSIDRITNNHRLLSKRFEMDSLNGKSDRDKCFSVCEMVCTYNQPVNVRFNIALEEMAYLNFMDESNMSDADMVKNITDYFLMSESEDISTYKNAIKNSKIICNEADDLVPYVFGKKVCCPKWEEEINEWMINPSKDINGLISIIKENYSDVNTLNKIIDRINEYTSINDIDFNPINIFNNIGYISDSKEAKNIATLIKENNISDSDDLVFNLRAIWEAEFNDSQYIDPKNGNQIMIKDINKIKMNNLISDSQAVGEFLDHLENTSMKEAPVNIKKILSNKTDDNLNESTLQNHIDPNGYLTIKTRSYMIENGNIEDLNDFLEQSIKCINNALYNTDSKAYCVVSENGFDIYVKSKYSIYPYNLTERAFSDPDMETICNIKHYVNEAEYIADNKELNAIISKLHEDKDYAASVTADEVKIMYEALNPIINNSEIIDEFIESCNYEANPNYDKIKDICSSIDEEYINYNCMNDRIHICAEMMGVSESKVNDEEKSDIEDDEKKKTIKSLNDIKLAWQGVKAKLKKASAKEQEISRDIDVEYNHLLKTIQSAGPDHREEIITGEVNHSLSRLIKIGIALAGVGVAAQSAILPGIMAVAMFAKSKHTSVKEKKMIIDEIDIELQVLDREINRAEQSGSTKKYRQLLTIQKNLMRKRQEIYYGLAKKGKRIPMQATAGLRNRE